MIALPEICELKRITQALATLDLILCPDWEGRYYSYDSNWSGAEEMASMRNGCGDDWFILFDSSGPAGLKGVAHEYPASRDSGLVERVMAALPQELTGFANEPAFHWEATSFCYWRLPGETSWNEIPGLEPADSGAGEFLGILLDPVSEYHQFAAEYYERELDRTVIDHVMNHQPITPEIGSHLNPEFGRGAIQEELEQIGYPA